MPAVQNAPSGIRLPHQAGLPLRPLLPSHRPAHPSCL
jgi:hypothetical protein